MRRRSLSRLMPAQKMILEMEQQDWHVNGDDRKYDWNERQFALITLNKQTFWYKSLEYLLYIHDYDPYAIFKRLERQKYEPAHSERGKRSRATSSPDFISSVFMGHRYMSDLPKLRLPVKRSDKTRHQFGHITRTYAIYFFVKALIVSFAQYAILRNRYLVPRGYQPALLSESVIDLITDHLGNPLLVLKDISMLFYTAPSGLLVISFVLLYLYYEKNPLNIAPLRFIMGPVHEVKRVDSNIRRKLKDIRTSLEVYEQQKRQTLLNPFRDMEVATNTNYCHLHLAPVCLREAKDQLRLEKEFCSKIRNYLDDFDRRMHIFRPDVYSSKYFEESSAKMSGIVAAGHLIYIFCTLVLVSSLELVPYLDRCRLHQQRLSTTLEQSSTSYCNPFKIYTLPEMLMLFELALNFTLGWFVSALNIILSTIVNQVQGDLVTSVRHQVIECRNLILHAKSRRRSFNKFMKSRKEEMDPDKFMLESLIKMTVCESEMRDNSRSMSELTIHPFYYAGVIVTFLVLVSGQFKIPESMGIGRFLMIVTWVNVNAVAVACAHTFSRVVGCQRVMWLVLAAQTIRSNQLEQRYRNNLSRLSDRETSALEQEGEIGRHNTRSCTLVTDLWVKFVLATSLNIERYCARPLNVKLTYQMIIEMNFFVIFIYSLSLDFLDHKRV